MSFDCPSRISGETMRVIIADDEPVAVERLQLALSCVPEVELVGIAKSGREALTLIKERQPDVAILDIQMPAQNGFGVLAALRPTDKIPEVIFVTAFENHALKAFEINAVDYLLKPVPFERLRDAVRRAKERLQARAADARFAELQSIIAALSSPEGERARYEFEIWVKDRDGVTRIPTETVDMFEAAGDYVIAHVGRTTHFLSDSLNALENRLDPQMLLRVHRSAIVNLGQVRSLRRRGPRALSLILQSGKQVPVGPTYSDAVLKAMKVRRWRLVRADADYC